jgi:hypothetical protein
VENHVSVFRVALVFVVEPVGGTGIDLNIASLRCLASDLDNGTPEVGPGFQVEEAGMQNEHRITVDSP